MAARGTGPGCFLAAGRMLVPVVAPQGPSTLKSRAHPRRWAQLCCDRSQWRSCWLLGTQQAKVPHAMLCRRRRMRTEVPLQSGRSPASQAGPDPAPCGPAPLLLQRCFQPSQHRRSRSVVCWSLSCRNTGQGAGGASVCPVARFSSRVCLQSSGTACSDAGV